jgi:NDP-sugar pyrophosphorylase family protein
MQIVIPVGGDKVFFPEKDFFFSKPLVEVSGGPMISVVANNIYANFPDDKLIFIVDQEDIDSFSIDAVIMNSVGPNVEIVARTKPTSGALCSALLAIDIIDLDEELLVLNGDQIILCNMARIISELRDEKANAGVATIKSSHPRWSYALTDKNQNVLQVAEKKVISKQAIAGLYYFDSGCCFVDSASKTMLAEKVLNGKYYLSPTLNEVILKGGVVKSVEISVSDYHSFYSPSRIELYEKSHAAGKTGVSCINVVIPAAGRGSRFSSEGWKSPKPFIDVGGEMMIHRVIENVSPSDSKVNVMVQSQHKHFCRDLNSVDVDFIEVNEVTEGTACTVLLGRILIDNTSPLLIANSDQIIDFDVNQFIKDYEERNLDGSILVFKANDPKWSYAKLDSHGYVVEVAEKRVISDLATVGIYLFKRGDEFVNAALDMIVRNDRVNGEFYTCPVYNYLIKTGKRIGVYEIKASQMHGTGTPEDLLSYMSLMNLPSSVDAP